MVRVDHIHADRAVAYERFAGARLWRVERLETHDFGCTGLGYSDSVLHAAGATLQAFRGFRARHAAGRLALCWFQAGWGHPAGYGIENGMLTDAFDLKPSKTPKSAAER